MSEQTVERANAPEAPRSGLADTLLWLCLGVIAGLAICLMFLYVYISSPAYKTRTEKAAIGYLAPDFSAETVGGGEITLSDLRGRVVAVRFWATWCGVCRMEQPVIDAAEGDYPDSEFMVLDVNMREASALVRSTVREEGRAYPVLLDPYGEISRLYRVRALPTTIWIDAEGLVQGRHEGNMSRATIDDYIRTLSAGR